MSQFWQTYFSGDAQITALNAAITSNGTDTALVATYSTARANLFSAVGTAEATAFATPNSTNLNALVTAVQNRDTLINANSKAATVADQAVNGQTGTIMTRTVPLIVAALQVAVVKVNAAIAAIGYGGSVTVTNAALRDSLAPQVAVANAFLLQSASWLKPGDFAGAVAWLVGS